MPGRSLTILESPPMPIRRGRRVTINVDRIVEEARETPGEWRRIRETFTRAMSSNRHREMTFASRPGSRTIFTKALRPGERLEAAIRSIPGKPKSYNLYYRLVVDVAETTEP